MSEEYEKIILEISKQLLSLANSMTDLRYKVEALEETIIENTKRKGDDNAG